MILVDPRVGTTARKTRSERFEELMKLFEALKVPAEEARPQLPFGDFAFQNERGEEAGIELKTIRDLVSSMVNGRLVEHQIPGMTERYRRSWLIVEGFYRARRGNGILEVPRGAGWMPLWLGRRPIFWAAVEGFLTSVEQEGGVFLRRTRTPYETAIMVRQLHEWWQKRDHRSFKSLKTPVPVHGRLRAEHPVTKRMRLVARDLSDGIGWDRSQKVASAFDSVIDMVTAGESRWREIDGIGSKLAKAVVRNVLETRAEGRSQ